MNRTTPIPQTLSQNKIYVLKQKPARTSTVPRELPICATYLLEPRISTHLDLVLYKL